MCQIGHCCQLVDEMKSEVEKWKRKNNAMMLIGDQVAIVFSALFGYMRMNTNEGLESCKRTVQEHMYQSSRESF